MPDPRIQGIIRLYYHLDSRIRDCVPPENDVERKKSENDIGRKKSEGNVGSKNPQSFDKNLGRAQGLDKTR